MKINFSDIIGKIQEVILTPKTFWKSQKENDEELSVLLGNYFFPLLLIVVFVVFLGEFFRSAHFYVVFALLKAIRIFVLFSVAFFASVYFTNTLLKFFGGEKNYKRMKQLITYSFTPFLLVSLISGLFPFLYPLDVLGIYSFYIFWVGGKELLSLPKQNRDRYLIISVLVNFFIFSFLSIVLSKLLTLYY